MRAFVTFFMTIAIGFTARAQQVLDLPTCYELATKNYPLIKQQSLIKASYAYNLDNIQKGLLPQLNFNGQATYQSEVPEFKFPGINVKSLPKDQYKFYAEASQSLTDLLVSKDQKALLENNEHLQTSQMIVELYKVKERINQLYFGVLLTDQQIKLNELLTADLQNGLNKISAAIKNGVEYKSSEDKIKAEMIRNGQRKTELAYQRLAYTEMLGYFINQKITAATIFKTPEAPVPANQIQRHELALFDTKGKMYTIQQKLLIDRSLPKVGLFLQGGAGQPSPLNFINREFSPYFIGGLRLTWNFNNYFTRKNDSKNIQLEAERNNIDKEIFLFNLTILVNQQQQELGKYQSLISADEELVVLRNAIKNTAKAQLENGIITTNDYIKEVNAEDQARQNKALHEIQLLMSSYQLQYTTGN